eukprot:TRINITY_DN8543_c0_g2_i2.p1 TRINITY_DN8543_c0_g2~~TRINITY_DN8543_c0_g2_i2.p1  ORF type:complete len:193 (+),score=58.30 TRINITY_DN8543_c0_g2_i2:25-579(+)
MIRRPPRSTHCISSAASDVYKRQVLGIRKNLVNERSIKTISDKGLYEDNTNKELEERYKALQKKYEVVCNRVKDMGEKVMNLKDEFENLKGELIESLIRITVRSCYKEFKKLFIKCYGIIKSIKKCRDLADDNNKEKRNEANKFQIITNKRVESTPTKEDCIKQRLESSLILQSTKDENKTTKP